MARPHTVAQAALTTFNIDARESFNGANSGSVTVDLQSRIVSINLAFRPICGAGMACPQFIRELGQIALPLVSAQPTSCGSVVYTATRDLMTVDGGFQSIVVTDNTRFRCESLVAMQPTTVVVREIPARATFNEERVSNFDAGALQTILAQPTFAQQPVAQPIARPTFGR
jgi:hypothetical protein